MKRRMIIFLFLIGMGTSFAQDKKEAPQPCQDELTMVADYQKGIADMVGTVQKESLEDFSRAYHRRSCLSKLSLSEGILEVATACLEEALNASGTPKAQKEGLQSKREAYAKLKEKLAQYHNSLKAKEEDKDAKALIEKFDLSNQGATE